MRSRCFVSVLAGIAIAVGGLLAAADQLTGHVKAVNPATNSLVVTQTGTGADYVIAVTGQTSVVNTRGDVLTLRDLRKGDGVSFSLVGNVATMLVADQARLVGLVVSVDTEGNKIVLKGASGKEITVIVDDQTTIKTIGGKSLKFRDLKEGAGVAVAHVGDLARKIEVRPKPEEMTGHVKSVAADLKTFVVKELGSNKDVTVAFDPDTIIETAQGKTLKSSDLKAGDGVGISHVGSVAQKIVVDVQPER